MMSHGTERSGGGRRSDECIVLEDHDWMRERVGNMNESESESEC